MAEREKGALVACTCNHQLSRVRLAADTTSRGIRPRVRHVWCRIYRDRTRVVMAGRRRYANLDRHAGGNASIGRRESNRSRSTFKISSQDGTQPTLTDEGWLYLAGVKDVLTCELLGYSMGPRMTQDLTAQALWRAVRSKRPAPGLIHHSDRGTQYCADDYQSLSRSSACRRPCRERETAMTTRQWRASGAA